MLKGLGIDPELVGDDACSWLLRAEALVIEYPDTAGLLRSSYDLVRSYWEGSKTAAIDLWAGETRKFWKQWGEYEVGSLVYCERGHPYSRRSFPGCPECGRKVAPKPPKSQADYERNLNREEFLRALNWMAGIH